MKAKQGGNAKKEAAKICRQGIFVEERGKSGLKFVKSWSTLYNAPDNSKWQLMRIENQGSKVTETWKYVPPPRR